MNNYFHSEEEVDSGNICRQKQASTESKFGWCDFATKYMTNAKVNLRKENNEVARGPTSDVVCTLVQPISGQDRAGEM